MSMSIEIGFSGMPYFIMGVALKPKNHDLITHNNNDNNNHTSRRIDERKKSDNAMCFTVQLTKATTFLI
jgi:hypothetical protein